MRDSISHIAIAIREARKKLGISQRELSRRSGLPQSHISKIENGEIDLQTSSLIQIARSLEMELVMIPQKLYPVFQSLEKRITGRKKQVPMYRLDDDDSEEDDE
jgi:transcriptional regulator with XRE-family HTH domain